MTDIKENPFVQASTRRKLLTLIGIYVAALITRFISTSSFTILPMAALDVGGLDIYPLASTASGLLSICAMPLYGYFGSRNPSLKRPLLLFSLLVGAVVFFVEACAPNMVVIICANFFYGVVSASIFVVAFSLIRDMYDAKQAGIYLGFIGTVTSIGMLVGPALAGLLIDGFGWRFAYHVCWPLLLLAVVFIALGAKGGRSEAQASAQAKTFDLPGLIALVLFLLGLTLSLSLGSSYIPFGSAGNDVLVMLAAASLLVLVLIIRKKRAAAIIPSTVLRDRNTVVLALCSALSTFSTMALTFFMPAYIINVLHGSALQAGLGTAIYAILGVFICPFLGRAIAKARTARPVFTIGTIVRVAVSFILALILSAQTPVWVIYLMMFIAGFYSAQQNVTFSTAPQIQIKSAIRFLSNSVVQTAQNLGSSVGLAIYTMMMATWGIAEGLPRVLILAGVVAVVALAIGQFLRKVEDESEAEAH
ncbi:MAG: MFS transporter [Coriobacteriales bacterium]|jgi:MFS family permease|nr:MFS transporter [Coriobacteriales bacterium]